MRFRFKTIGERRVVHYLVLAIPFIVMIGLFHGLTEHVPTFHHDDEPNGHLPLILTFARQFPRLDLSYSLVTTTPLFHILFMLAGKVIGFDLYKLRLLNALISYLAVLVLYRFLRSRIKLEPDKAFWSALLFALSPYYFGASFILLTDNLAYLFCFLALDYFCKLQTTARLRDCVIGCCLTSACILTRQLYVWLIVVACVFILTMKWDIRKKFVSLLLVGLSSVPLLLLMLTWKGFVPPFWQNQFQGEKTIFQTMAHCLSPINFMLALLGMYSVALNPQQYLAAVNPRAVQVSPWWHLLVPVAVGVLLLLMHPAVWHGDDGLLWRLSARLPTVLSSGVSFWLFVPSGLLAIYFNVTSARIHSTLPLMIIGSFMLVSMANRVLYQKYFDPFVLFAAFLLIEDRILSTRLSQLGYAALVVAFIGYALLHSPLGKQIFVH